MHPSKIDPEQILWQQYTAVLIADTDFGICWTNPQAEQLFSVSSSRLLEYSILKILEPIPTDLSINNRTDSNNDPYYADDSKYVKTDSLKDINITKLAQQFRYASQNQQSFLNNNQYITGISRPLLVDYNITPIEQNSEVYYLIELWKKNNQNRIDKEQRQIEQHDVARQMLRSVAHEVKNPLAGIRGAAQLLSRLITSKSYPNKKQTSANTCIQPLVNPDSLDDSFYNLVKVNASKFKTYTDIVISETDRLTNLIEKLLGSNQLLQLQEVNIHEPLEHVLMLTATQHPNVRIMRDYDLSLPKLIADKDQLIQIFLNLINNACNAMLEQNFDDLMLDDCCLDNANLHNGHPKNLDPYQPTLTISTRIRFQYTIGMVTHRQVLNICIKDNGIGIDPDMLERIFYPLVTGRASGTGLGLSLVQDMLNHHHGMIHVESQRGDTTFCIYLPFKQPDSATNR